MGAAVAMIGLVGSAAPSSPRCVACPPSVRHAFLFTFLARDSSALDADGHRLIADLRVRGFAGLLALVAVALSRRIASRHSHTGRGAGRPAVACGSGTVGGRP